MFVRWQTRIRVRPHPVNYMGIRDILAKWKGVAVARPQTKIGDRYVTTRSKTAKPDVHLAAILVKSVRRNGKPVQQHVAYLGGITEGENEERFPRWWFWDWMTKKLDKLKISAKERRAVENAIAKRIPRPSKRQSDRIMHTLDRYYLWPRSDPRWNRPEAIRGRAAKAEPEA
jgi:hypothetical protein